MAEKEIGEKQTKKKRRKISAYYQINEKGELKRLLPHCERCGPGYFMADHGDRYTCGHCSLTRYKQT